MPLTRLGSASTPILIAVFEQRADEFRADFICINATLTPPLKLAKLHSSKHHYYAVYRASTFFLEWACKSMLASP